jgi:hypothetical protein
VRRAAVRLLGAALSAVALLGAPLPRGARAAPLRDAPIIWQEVDRYDLPSAPAARDPNQTWTSANGTFFRPVGRLVNPVRLGRRVGSLFGGNNVRNASDVNALDEVPNSTWFTNRIGLYPFAPEDVARGPGGGPGPRPEGGTGGTLGPSRDAAWTVIRAKTQGVTPGFDIQDARGQVYLIKFDPPGELGTTSAAAVISGRILHAIGYNVPDDEVVTFARGDLRLAPNATIRDRDGGKRPMTDSDLESILARVDPLPDGRWLAIASGFLDGKPIGPFSDKGRRQDDPNDRVRHEERRELRALRMFCAWLDHWDMKEQNSLDMYVEENGRRFVRHHLIDFASTLGAAAGGGAQPRFGYEHTIDFPPIAGRFLALGLHEDGWRRIRRPDGLPEVGYFESREFQPMEWKPLQPNAAFANLNRRDGYWAAKILSAFTDEHLRAAVSTGGYRDPRAAEYVTRTLAERRDKIARYWFDRMPPLDFFVPRGDALMFHDLGVERGLYPGPKPSYRVRCAVVDADRNAARWTEWSDLQGTALPLASGAAAEALRGASETARPFLAMEFQVKRDAGWSRSVHVYASRVSGRVVAVER